MSQHQKEPPLPHLSQHVHDVEADEIGQHDAEEHRHHLADVRRQQVAQELADIVEDGAALLDCGDDRREVVVGEHHVGGLFGDVGARNPHCDANVGLLERRRVVDAVAGHRHDRAGPPQCVDDLQLVLRIDARIHGDVRNRPHGRIRCERVELATRDRTAVVADTELVCDHDVDLLSQCFHLRRKVQIWNVGSHLGGG